MDPFSDAPDNIAFGRYRVLPHRRELLADGQPIKLGGRAFDVLMALIEASGAVVGKNALMARVWPDRIIEENNLHTQIVALRKAFGAERDLIRRVSGRGYQFTGAIRLYRYQPGAASGARCRLLQPARHGGAVDQGGTIEWTRLSCRTVATNAVRLQLHVLAYNFGNFVQTLAMPKTAQPWSLTSLHKKLITIGAKVVSRGRYLTCEMGRGRGVATDVDLPLPNPVRSAILAFETAGDLVNVG